MFHGYHDAAHTQHPLQYTTLPQSKRWLPGLKPIRDPPYHAIPAVYTIIYLEAQAGSCRREKVKWTYVGQAPEVS